MFKWTSVLVDLLSGLLFVALAFFSARVLLQHPSLTYLCFPLLATAAGAVGFWRGGRSSRFALVTAVLVTTPLLIVALEFFSGRNKPFMLFPIVVFIFVSAGAFARLRGNVPIIAGVLVVAAVAGAFAGPPFVHLIVPAANVMEKPVPFMIRMADGTIVSSQSLRGKVVVLDFWATWCMPCRRELPLIERAYRASKSHPDVAFFAVDGVMTDVPGDAGDTAERATAFFRQGGFTTPLAWDGGGVLEKTFRLHGFPTLLVIDRGGSVRMRHVGFIGGEDLESVLTGKIAELRAEGR